MTKPSIALADLLEKGTDTDLLREMISHIVELVMHFDVENLCDAGYGERSPERQNSRNGYRERLRETRAGSIAVKIPKLRSGSYFPPFLEPCRTAEKAQAAVIQETCIQGVSTRSVDELVKAMGLSGISRSRVSYNLRGMRTQLVDADLGTWSFSSNALGEVISQTDAKGQTTSFAYDALGRLTTRTEAEGTSIWTWGSSATDRNIGRLESVAGPGYGESYTYDSRGRLSTRSITSDTSYQYDYAYNALGQLHTLTWPNSTAGVRFKAKYGYAGGQLVSVQDYTGNVNGPQLWGVNLLDASGRAVSESYGNGLWVQNGFHALTGEASTRKAGTGGAETNVQHLLYNWDTAGNLTTRQDLRQGLTESFSYDALDRLTGTTGPGGTLTVAYDAIGNITSRSDVGSYTYHASKKHAVIAAGSNSYGYDANGNLTTRNGSSITWTSANLPATINAGGYSATFSYAPDRSRWRQVSTYAGGNETTIYVGGMLEKLTTAVRTHWKHLIPTPSGQVQVIRRSDGTTETLYVTTDHLGSTEAVLNAAGTVLARTSFASWGARRASSWQGAPASPEWQAIADTTRRGYTGHEHLDNVMLVHMNGRVYDPAIGRFISADPFVDGVEGSQGLNRYAYVHSNPITHTDPTGYSFVRGSSLNWKLAWINRDRTQSNLEPVVIGTSQRVVILPGGMEDVQTDYTTIWPSWQTDLADWFRSARLERGAGAEPDVDAAAERRDRDRPQGDPLDDLKKGVCEVGNALQSIADIGYDLGLGLQVAGGPVALIGFAAGGVPAAIPGVTAMGIGGAISWASSGIQTVGGLMQYAGDSMTANGNVLAGAASVLTGGAMHGIGGSFLRSGTNYVARARNASVQLRLAFAGVGVDLASSALQGLAPRQANCE